MAQSKADKYLNMTPKWYRPSDPQLFFWGKRMELLLGLHKKLRRNREIRRHFGVSQTAYDQYDDWEMRAYEGGSNWTIRNGRMALVRFCDIRAYYLAPIIAEIEALQGTMERPVRVLEVGCGNGTNLKVINDHFGAGVRLRGIDISPERLRLGRDYWKTALDGVDMGVGSAITLATEGDGSADLVYSVHCLEQIPYAVDACLAAMARVTENRVVFVEPVWEFANPTQKMYTLFGDQLRTLLPSLGQSDLEVVTLRKAEILANPLNQTGIVVARKRTV